VQVGKYLTGVDERMRETGFGIGLSILSMRWRYRDCGRKDDGEEGDRQSLHWYRVT
jgi:hypothetical protein